MKKPFFIVGCVRSGTTMLRNVLRCHPNLAAPEETHFFRWSHPFGNNQSDKSLTGNATLKKHREIDGISEKEFEEMLKNSVSRSDLQKRYMEAFLKKNNLSDKRWFDKTPQNIYCSSLIATEFPRSKFIHIVRDPLDVVSSLRIGKVVKVEEIVAACNYWNEAASLIYTLKRAYPKRVYEVKYEQFTANFLPELEKMLNFIDEEFDPKYFIHLNIQAKEHSHSHLFTDLELEKIKNLCQYWGTHYEYFTKS